MPNTSLLSKPMDPPRKPASAGWARIELLVMRSEKRQNERTDKIVDAIKDSVEHRLDALEKKDIADAGEHREIVGRLDAQKDALGKLEKGQDTIKDALILGRAIAAIVRWLRGK